MCIGAVATFASCPAAAHAKTKGRKIERTTTRMFCNVLVLETPLPEVNEEWEGDYSKFGMSSCLVYCRRLRSFQLSVSR